MVLSAQEFMVRWEEVISWNSNSWEKFSSLKLLKSSDEVIVRKEGRDHQGSIKHRLWNPKTLIAWETLEEFGYPLLYLLALSTSVLVLGISRINICRNICRKKVCIHLCRKRYNGLYYWRLTWRSQCFIRGQEKCRSQK